MQIDEKCCYRHKSWRYNVFVFSHCHRSWWNSCERQFSEGRIEMYFSFRQRKDENGFSKKVEDTRFRIREGGQENLFSPWIIFKNNNNWEGEEAVFTPLMFLDEISPLQEDIVQEKKGFLFSHDFTPRLETKLAE